jgi:hypothetical protein
MKCSMMCWGAPPACAANCNQAFSAAFVPSLPPHECLGADLAALVEQLKMQHGEQLSDWHHAPSETYLLCAQPEGA